MVIEIERPLVLRFRLPGEWWPIPLQSEHVAKESIRRLIDRQVGRADDRAILRDGLRGQFYDAVERAVAGDGQSMHIALDVVEELPLSSSFTVFILPQQLTPAIGESGEALIAVLRAGLESAQPEAVSTLVEFTTGSSRVLRSHSTTVGSDEPPTLPSLIANYWISMPGTKRVVLVSFVTAYAELEEVMLTFFDSIMRAAYWEERASPPG